MKSEAREHPQNRTYTIVALGIILSASATVHFLRINYPAAPVFDEMHFASYAADYAAHQPFFDIHPPLGKLMYAAVLCLTGERPTHAQFITERYDPLHKVIDDHWNGDAYGDFPYVALRSASAAIGVLLVLVFYWFLRTIGVGNLAALLGSFFIALENALITQTRFILLDGLLWVLALAALALYFRKPQRPLLAGMLWGLALAVKLSAIVFAGPTLIYELLSLQKTFNAEPWWYRFRSLRGFLAVGFAVLAFFIVINPFLSSLEGQASTLNALYNLHFTLTPLTGWQAQIQNYISILVTENAIAFLSYTSAVNPITSASPWYFWPAKQTPFAYFTGDPNQAQFSKSIVFDGNPVVWYASTLAVVLGIAAAWRYVFAPPPLQTQSNRITFAVLLGGYLITLLPFITIVHRATFLYHYLPSLLFAVGLLAWFIGHCLKLDDFSTLTKQQVIILLLVCAAVVAGFLVKAPLTYAL